ncbi:MAG: hypothetical protein RR540_08075, partial [Oscillospiraceae bacterium]
STQCETQVMQDCSLWISLTIYNKVSSRSLKPPPNDEKSRNKVYKKFTFAYYFVQKRTKKRLYYFIQPL